MRGWVAGAAGALLLSAAALGGTAQERAADPLDAPISATQAAVVSEVTVGRHVYQVPADEVLVAYVDAREAGLDGTTVTMRVFLRTGDGWLAMPPYRTAATGTVANGQVGDALILAPEPVN